MITMRSSVKYVDVGVISGQMYANEKGEFDPFFAMCGHFNRSITKPRMQNHNNAVAFSPV